MAVSVLGALCAVIFIYLIIQFDSKRWIIGIAIMLTIFASFMYTWPIQGLLPTYLRGVGMDQTVVANVVSFAGLGNAAGYIIAGFAGDKFGMRRWYAISLLLSQIIVFPLFMQNGKYVALVAGMLFFQQMFGQGVSGLLPKWVSSYFPVDSALRVSASATTWVPRWRGWPGSRCCYRRAVLPRLRPGDPVLRFCRGRHGVDRCERAAPASKEDWAAVCSS